VLALPPPQVVFAKATANFVRQIDPEGTLISVCRLNDSDKLVPMALVVKRNRFWFCQKYQPSGFTLNVSESDFLSYDGRFGDNRSGKLDAKAGNVSVNIERRGSSKLQSSFGKLKKQDVDVRKLLLASNDRMVDMQHVLVQQCQKRAGVFAVLKERVLTTTPCSISEQVQEQGKCQGVLGLLGKLGKQTVQVDLQELDLEVYVGQLAVLPESTRFALFQSLREVLVDRTTLSVLEHMAQSYLTQNISPHLTATHLLVSALDALPKAALTLLGQSSPDVLEALNPLVTKLKVNGQSLPLESLPLSLQDEGAFHWAEQLLLSSNVTLRRETDRLWAETG
ncbi:unnamed protein product, partial [Coregonus sp. 'balchen']